MARLAAVCRRAVRVQVGDTDGGAGSVEVAAAEDRRPQRLAAADAGEDQVRGALAGDVVDEAAARNAGTGTSRRWWVWASPRPARDRGP